MGGAERLLPGFTALCPGVRQGHSCRFKGLLKAQAGDQYCSGTVCG